MGTGQEFLWEEFSYDPVTVPLSGRNENIAGLNVQNGTMEVFYQTSGSLFLSKINLEMPPSEVLTYKEVVSGSPGKIIREKLPDGSALLLQFPTSNEIISWPDTYFD